MAKEKKESGEESMGRRAKRYEEILEELEGDEEAKRRLKVILESLLGSRSVFQACDELGIKETRFRQMRYDMVSAMLDALTPGLPGRPRKEREEDPLKQARHENAVLRHIIVLSKVREELSLTIPGVIKKKGSGKGRGKGEK